ncbi:acetyl/propionyl/methylcrotonyl-CoA carboxylase subunit alpha [Motiliproteus coralliicola]|uniref:Biotin carboxylase n=1 Tax=Motiliproteus coralliicola TaxID=2283196 RepID=A0A369WV51_9GAMM|nr:acetyl/propionyl/methylcrotonyl-CoA carboxylase subunit alpha [Motiliproteus coralliicola]RDE25003.1 acetyl/propionyl/methylcrotonyl-CoA carboxylase subunit alpha [Motiliproteus coralliicola]
MFTKILIANRGEIACRIIETAHKMGVKCVAVYSEADRNARHVALADEAFLLGPAPSRDSYLRIDKIIEAAKISGAQAVHPGYGFLSENAEFAKALAENGLAFIGPPVGAIEAMGSKSAAKTIMENAGVPLVPGYHGDDQSRELIKAEAARCGYPVLLKAVAGGGGKGMRVVWQESEFDEAFDAAKREGESSFNNGDLLVEKYLTKPRHVELQVFCDRHGNGVYLGDRDCSVQRRHQKVIEEAPAPNISDEIRKAMGESAVQAAKAIDYVGAGTVEFLYDEDGSYYFMEMNTRLQVEHPVTELVTRQDLVEWQLRVAAGQPLPLAQSDISLHGHSLEVRVYAEDPDADFTPATGTLDYLRTPVESKYVRVDTGVIEGDTVSHYYDPMIAKLIVWDESRELALTRMQQALEDYRICGLKTNLGFLSKLAGSESFRRFDVDTGFIERHHDQLFSNDEIDEQRYIALAACYLTLARKASSANQDDPTSPFNRLNSLRLNSQYAQPYELTHGENNHAVSVLEQDQDFLIRVDNSEFQVKGQLSGDQLSATLNGHRFSVSVFQKEADITLFHDGCQFECQRHVEIHGDAEGEQAGSLAAPMTGTVVAVLKQAGDQVEAGEGLIVIEAMKMEQTISAPFDGTVSEVFFNAGDLVDEGAELLGLEPCGEE